LVNIGVQSINQSLGGLTWPK